jgi:hypothetical protein
MREHTTMRRECFTLSAISKPETRHTLAQVTDFALRRLKSRESEQNARPLAITEELPRAHLIAARCKKG